jgi:hypothetical protein
MDSVSPVWTENEVDLERVIALDQKQYFPIVILPVKFSDGSSGLSVRFRLTDAERKAIADGADLLVTQLNFDNPFTPLCMDVCAPNTNPFTPAPPTHEGAL